MNNDHSWLSIYNSTHQHVWKDAQWRPSLPVFDLVQALFQAVKLADLLLSQIWATWIWAWSPSDKPDKPAERSMRWKEIIAPLASYERKKSKGSSDSNCSPAQNVSQCSNTEPWSRPAASGYSATAPGGLAWSALLHWHPELLYEHPKLTALPRIFINFIVHSFLPIKLATYRGFRKWGYTCSSSTSDFPL
jgi:hypothetical protein